MAKGWSNGFAAKQEAERASGGRVVAYQCDRRVGLFYRSLSPVEQDHVVNA